jgi:transcription antitermination protein NusB
MNNATDTKPAGVGVPKGASTRPPRQSRTGLTSTGARKAASKPPRSRSREFALQALYQHLIGKNAVDDIDAFTRDLAGFGKCDIPFFSALLHGCVEQAQSLDDQVVPLLDRSLSEISPVERAIMWIGAYEFKHCPDVPWRVVLNECIELAKEFGGTDGYKYVNAVLNGLAPLLRDQEVKSDKGHGARQSGKKNAKPE